MMDLTCFLVTGGDFHLDFHRILLAWNERAILDGLNGLHLCFDGSQLDDPVHATKSAKYSIGL